MRPHRKVPISAPPFIYRFSRDWEKAEFQKILQQIHEYVNVPWRYVSAEKSVFPVVLLNMVSREVKPVEGIKFCSSFLRGQLKASVNEKSPSDRGSL